MYINPFVAGALFVVLIECIGLILGGLIAKAKEDNDGEEK